MDKKSLGLYRKFNVSRTDGSSEPGEQHDGCEYFVLDMTHDPLAKPAILAYADACEKDGYVVLAQELRGKFKNE